MDEGDADDPDYDYDLSFEDDDEECESEATENEEGVSDNQCVHTLLGITLRLFMCFFHAVLSVYPRPKIQVADLTERTCYVSIYLSCWDDTGKVHHKLRIDHSTKFSTIFDMFSSKRPDLEIDHFKNDKIDFACDPEDDVWSLLSRSFSSLHLHCSETSEW